MTTMLIWLFVILVGDRLRLRAPRRRPASLVTASAGDADLAPDAGRIAQRRYRWSTFTERTRRRVDIAPEHVAAWADGLAGAIRSGSTLAAAIRDIEPPRSCAPAVASIRLASRRGTSLRQACEIEPCPPHLDLALAVIRACAENGGPPAEPLSRAAATLRGRAADAAERRTQSAQARMSAVVMTVLPICMLGLLLLTSSSVRLFIGSPVGAGVVTVGALLNLLGWLWMRRLIDGGRR
jgi:Flp pilus assembly protein TadB